MKRRQYCINCRHGIRDCGGHNEPECGANLADVQELLCDPVDGLIGEENTGPGGYTLCRTIRTARPDKCPLYEDE